MNASITIFGAAYSVYTRIALLALEEKSVDYTLHEVDIFSASEDDPDANRHPFRKIPTLSQGNLDLYETAAIVRYVDDSFPSPPLVPADTDQRARMNQIISILDNYAYLSWVWGLYVELISNPQDDLPTDREAVETATIRSRTCLSAITDLYEGDSPYLVGEQLTLADLYAVPMYAYLIMTEVGQEMVEDSPWFDWWESMQRRESVIKTRFQGET